MDRSRVERLWHPQYCLLLEHHQKKNHIQSLRSRPPEHKHEGLYSHSSFHPERRREFYPKLYLSIQFEPYARSYTIIGNPRPSRKPHFQNTRCLQTHKNSKILKLFNIYTLKRKRHPSTLRRFLETLMLHCTMSIGGEFGF